MNKKIKCYCGHTDYCDCEPLEEAKQEKIYSEKDLEEAFKSGFINCYTNKNLTFGEWFEQFNKK